MADHDDPRHVYQARAHRALHAAERSLTPPDEHATLFRSIRRHLTTGDPTMPNTADTTDTADHLAAIAAILRMDIDTLRAMVDQEPVTAQTTDPTTLEIARARAQAHNTDRARRVLFDFLTIVEDMTSAYRTGQNLNPPAPEPTVEQIMNRLREASREAHIAHLRALNDIWTNLPAAPRTA